MINTFNGPNLSSMLHHHWQSVSVTFFLRLLVKVWCFWFWENSRAVVCGLYSQVSTSSGLVDLHSSLQPWPATIISVTLKTAESVVHTHFLSILHRNIFSIQPQNTWRRRSISYWELTLKYCIFFVVGQFHQMWCNNNATQAVEHLSGVSVANGCSRGWMLVSELIRSSLIENLT